MNFFDKTRPIWSLSVEDFELLIKSLITEKETNSKKKTKVLDKNQYVYGIKGLADTLGCSKSHAQRLKSSGLFDEAITQLGRKIIIDKSKALEIAKNINNECKD